MGREAAGNTPPVRLDDLRRYLAGMEGLGKAATVLPFDRAELDSALPWGGVPLAALHEIEGSAVAGEDGAAATAFLAGILARLAPAKPILWCLRQPDLHPPGLALAGLAAQRLLLVRTSREQETLWAMEEGLRSRVLAAVVGEVDDLSITASRRLQLAAEASGITGFALHRRGGTGQASAAVTRWRVASLPAVPVVGEPGIGRPLWRIELLRCRGGVPASWDIEAQELEPQQLEVDDGRQSVAPSRHGVVPAALADRSPLRSRRAAG